MCFKRNKWQKFKPTKEFSVAVKNLTSVKKLHEFLKKYTWLKELKDYWKTPEEFLLESGDCEDFAIFALYVLVKIIKITKARVLIFSGYNEDKTGKELKGHAVVVFPWRGKLAILSNNKFHSGFNNHIEIGHKYYPDGLKYQEVRNHLGEILEKKRKWIGVF